MINFYEKMIELKKYYENNQNYIIFGFIDEKQKQFIIDTLELNKLSKIDITNLYNFAGLFFDNLLLTNKDDEYKLLIVHDCGSAIKFVISTYMK